MEPTIQSPTEMGLTPLADYSRQDFYVGRPAHFLFTTNGTKADRELAAMSIQLRLVEALEGTKGTKRLARLKVLITQKELFCQHVAQTATEWGINSLSVQGTEERPGLGAVVTVEYTEAEHLFYLGTRWERMLEAQRQQGEHQS